MGQINRTIPPPLNKMPEVSLPEPEKFFLPNGIPVYLINIGTQELIKIDFIFEGGCKSEPFPLATSSVSAMLTEGTSTRNASEISESIDSFGAFFQADPEKDFITVTLYTLNRFLGQTVEIVADLIKNSILPEKEFEIFRKNARQKFLINNKKPDFIARKNFQEMVFGANHPYGYNVKEADFNDLDLNLIRQYYKAAIRNDNCKIIIAGKIPSGINEILAANFTGDFGSKPKAQKKTILENYIHGKKVIERPEALQSVVIIGKRSVNRTNPDFPALQIANTFLGGYFGSRLMNNIREDKGYTYGINSGFASLMDSGYFYIMTEVGSEVCENALMEIYYELDKLSEELIGEDELNLVKNYLFGVFLRGVDGAFAIEEKLKTLLEYGMDLNYYYKYLKTLKNITPEEIRTLYRKYLKKDDMSQLIVGKPLLA